MLCAVHNINCKPFSLKLPPSIPADYALAAPTDVRLADSTTTALTIKWQVHRNYTKHEHAVKVTGSAEPTREKIIQAKH